jgi:hypothetical protein
MNCLFSSLSAKASLVFGISYGITDATVGPALSNSVANFFFNLNYKSDGYRAIRRKTRRWEYNQRYIF